MNEHEAIEALESLGLTTYEAKVFIALHRLGTGSARDVATVSDVPRPQVYATAESLEARGLIDIQQSDPLRYRPVAVDEAKTRLYNRFEHTTETAFEYIDGVRTESEDTAQREDIWTITGRETIDGRIAHLFRTAENEILFGVESTAQFGAAIETELTRAVAEGSSVTIISRDPELAERYDDTDRIQVETPAIEDHAGVSGRLVVVDDRSVLLSVIGEDTDGAESETAIWSSDTKFARVLIRLIRSYLQA